MSSAYAGVRYQYSLDQTLHTQNAYPAVGIAYPNVGILVLESKELKGHQYR